MWKSVLLLLGQVALINLSSGCHKKHLGAFFKEDIKKGGPEIHHHHYNKEGEELPHPSAYHQGPPHPYDGPHPHESYEGGTEFINSDGPPVKHVVVLQPAPPPVDEDLFESIFPKKFHPKHFLKHHVHKLRSKFRDLFFDDKKPIHSPHHGKLHHIHGKLHHHHHAPSPQPPPHVIYQPQKVAVPALKVPLVQVEAYKPAPPGHHPHYSRNPNVVAYVSPDGYQPAVVVKHRSPHGPHGPHGPHHREHVVAEPPHPPNEPTTYYGPAQDAAYHQHQPQQPPPYPPQQQVAYQPQPVAYGPQKPTQAYGPQQVVAYQPQEQPQQQAYQPYGTPQGPPEGLEQYQSSNYFGGQSPHSFGAGATNPFSSIDSSPFDGDSSIYK